MLCHGAIGPPYAELSGGHTGDCMANILETIVSPNLVDSLFPMAAVIIGASAVIIIVAVYIKMNGGPRRNAGGN